MTAANPTISVARVSVLLATLAVFLSLWLTIAVHPWNSPSAAPAVIPASPAAQPTGTVTPNVQPTGTVTPTVQLTAQQPVTTTRTS